MTLSRISKITAALILVAAVLAWLTYRPTHWLSRINFAAAKIDDQAIIIKAYIGHPSYHESDAICLLEIDGVGDYFLAFEDEKYRTASAKEFFRIGPGIWTFADMRAGHFNSPLPFRKINQFRIATSNGHILEIQF